MKDQKRRLRSAGIKETLWVKTQEGGTPATSFDRDRGQDGISDTQRLLPRRELALAEWKATAESV